MTTSQLEEHLKTVSPAVYGTLAPEGATEYVLWHRYGSHNLVANDTVILSLSKLQLDIIWQADAELCDRVKELLSDLSLPWEEIDYGYDDEWASMRCILQLELV